MISIDQQGNTLLLSTYDQSGKILLKKITIPTQEQFEWAICEESDPFRVKDKSSHTGLPVRKVGMRGKLSDSRVIELLSKLPDSTKDAIFNSNVPALYSVDIEVSANADGTFPDAEHALTSITTIAIFSSTGTSYVLGTKVLSPEQVENVERRIKEHFKSIPDALLPELKFKYLYYSTEVVMLKSLVQLCTQMPCITGWNFIKFDWQYIINRMKRLNIDYKPISPTKRFVPTYFTDKFNKELVHCAELPVHRFVFDYMEVYSVYDRSVKFKTSLNLGDVGQQVLGVKKLDYVGSLDDLYSNDYESYVVYNAIDTILVMLLHRKLNTLQLLLNLSKITWTELGSCMYMTRMVQNDMTRLYLTDNKVVILEKKDTEYDKYQGAFVLEPEVGKHKNIAIADYESQFPCIMLAFNMGVDTMVGRLLDDGKTIITLSGDYTELDLEEHIYTDNNIVYSKAKDSINRTLVATRFEQRRQAKYAVMELEQDIHYLKSLLQ